MFTLVVDDFLVKIISQECAQHLMNALKEKYEITIDWDAILYIGITLKWWFNQSKVQLSMPKYVPEEIKKIKQILSVKQQDSPAVHIPKKCGEIVQY